MTSDSLLVIGIAGGTGSGKTTLANHIKGEFGGDVTLIKHDNYYRAHDDLTLDERKKLNYDCPDAIETELLVEHLAALKRGEGIDCPVYDFTEHNRSKLTARVEPSKVIMIEGILIFADRRLCDMMDIRLFVDTDADVRLSRRIRRDVNERGRTLDSVLDQYISTVKPMHEQYVEPSKKNANVIIPDGGENLVALEMIIQQIRKHVNG